MKAGEKTTTQLEIIPLLEVATLACFLVLPSFVSDYLTIYSTRIIILCFLALSFDLAWGFAGIMSFGQAVFYGVAGYFVAIAARDLEITSVLAVIPLAALAGCTLALVTGLILLAGRSSTTMIFVALGTLIGSYAAERGLRGWAYIGGQNGIPSFPAITIAGTDLTEGIGYYYLCLVILVVVYLAIRYVTRSQLGLVLSSMRENETRIAYFGYRTGVLKVIVFTFAGGIAGIGGGLSAFYEGFVSPANVGVLLSTQAVIYVLLGGTGTRIGAVIGVIAIEGMSYWLSDNYREIWPIVLSMLLLAVVMVRPAGLVSLFVSESERVGSFGPRIWSKKRGCD